MLSAIESTDPWGMGMVRSDSMKYSPAQIKEMVSGYAGGLSFQESGAPFGADPKTVYYHVKKAGLPTRSLSEGYRNAERAGKCMSNVPRKFEVENYFEKIGPAEAWVLGLWLGDGCITSKGYKAVLAVGNDADVGEKVIEILGFTGNLRMSSCSDKCWLLEIWSKKFVDALRSVGAYERKAATFSLPVIADELMPHLIRGLWDADGWWSFKPRKDRPSWKLTGALELTSYKAMIQIADVASVVLGSAKLSKHEHGHCNDSYRFGVSHARARRWGKYLYKDSTEQTRCDRKYSVWLGGNS